MEITVANKHVVVEPVSIECLAERLEGVAILANERDARYAQLSAEREKAISAAMAAAEKAINAALAASEKAVAVAERNAEKWRDNANEWRQAMNDKDRNFVTKAVLWGYLSGVVGIMVAILGLLIKLFGGGR